MIGENSTATGVILAGGQSRRFGGEEKALIDLCGRPMLGHVVARVGRQVPRLVINANGDPSRFAAFGLPVIADSVAGFAGPLAGILAGMQWSLLTAPHAGAILTVPADAPFLPLDLVTRLREAVAKRPKTIALASTCGQVHYVAGLWPLAVMDQIASALERGEHAVMRFTAAHDTVPVPFPLGAIGGESVDPFFNVNTPADLEKARGLILGPVTKEGI